MDAVVVNMWSSRAADRVYARCERVWHRVWEGVHYPVHLVVQARVGAQVQSLIWEKAP